MFKVRDDVAIRIFEDAVEIYGHYQARLDGLAPRQLEVIQMLIEGVPSVHYLEYKKNPVFKAFMEKGLLIEVPEATEASRDRNERWLAHFEFRKERTYFDKKIMILGCGGTGSIVADHLARVGFRRFVLVDYAELNDEDLNRQLPYTRAMVGQEKTALLTAHLRDNFSVPEIGVVGKKLTEDIDEDFRKAKPDFIVNCADEPAYLIQVVATELARQVECPILFGAVGISDYLLGPLLVKDETKTAFQAYVRRQYECYGECSETIAGSNCILNTRASVDIAMECFLYLSEIRPPISVGTAWVFDPFLRTKKKQREF